MHDNYIIDVLRDAEENGIITNDVQHTLLGLLYMLLYAVINILSNYGCLC